ncbi:MAG: transporter substrate-binding domain-containing protein [Planctomycetota bacterium]|nr:transporter substrate-binding domain-containing protein [Planctomycetota bacterium]
MRIGLLLLLVASLLVGCGADEQADGPQATLLAAKARGHLIVALEPEFKPFEYLDDEGTLMGFDVDLAREIGKELGVGVQFRSVEWESILPSLLSGDADLIVSGMTATEERAQKVAFTRPYHQTITCLLLSTERAPGVADFEELNEPGRIVVVKEGTTGALAATERLKRATVKAYPTELAAAQEVATGLADAFLYDLVSIRNHHERAPSTTYVLDAPVTSEPYAIACRRDEPETVKRLDAILSAMEADGRLDALHQRYGLAR